MEFLSQLFLTWDPFGDRAKVFTKDLTFKVPGKIGKIYDFATGRILAFNKWQSICELYNMQDENTAPFLKWTGQDFQFFKSVEKAWSDASFEKTQFLGRVKIDNDGDIYELFANNLSFLDVEMNFESSMQGSRTLYFLKSSMNWIPLKVAQLEKSLSNMDKQDNSVMSGDKDLIIKIDGSVQTYD